MKLYYSPGACSLSPHIVLEEAGLKYDSESVDLRGKKTKSGADFNAINPKGYVPTLVLDDGQVLTEGVAIVQYLADRKPDSKLAAPAGSMDRYRLQEWLNFVATELHRNFGPLFNSKSPEDAKRAAQDRLQGRFGYVTKQLEAKKYLMGEAFTVADAYLFTMLSWARNVKLDVGSVLTAYYDRVRARPAVQAAIAAEGITI